MGTGALVGRRAALERLEPLRYGGDMVAWVSETEASFAGLPMRLERHPNVAGAVGLAAAADFIDRTGRSAIDAHVVALREHAAAGLAALPGVKLLSAETGASAIVSFAEACTRTTSARCSTSAASPCAPATARSRC
jgi:cysteine desulfurase/selenocysteine lyase